MKNNSNFALLFIGSVFVVLGIFIAMIGYFADRDLARFAAEAVSTEGVITNIETERYKRGSDTQTRIRYIVSVDYAVNGQEYENTVNEYKSTMRIGDEITLYYLPDAPWIVKGGINRPPVFAFIGFGGFFSIIGLFFLNSVRKKGMMKNYLKQNGKMIYAQVTEVERDLSISVSYGGAGGHPYSFIKCAVKHPGTDEIKDIYKSNSIKNDYLEKYVGKQVKVYLHPSDNKKYYVDLEELVG